jgi:hypothetical protein
LQRLNSLEQAERHFEEGVRRYTDHEYSAAAECFRCVVTFNAADIQAHVMLGSALIDPLVASGEYEATVIERPEIVSPLNWWKNQKAPRSQHGRPPERP